MLQAGIDKWFVRTKDYLSRPWRRWSEDIEISKGKVVRRHEDVCGGGYTVPLFFDITYLMNASG
jgi:hypothetical protein